GWVPPPQRGAGPVASSILLPDRSDRNPLSIAAALRGAPRPRTRKGPRYPYRAPPTSAPLPATEHTPPSHARHALDPSGSKHSRPSVHRVLPGRQRYTTSFRQVCPTY